MIKEFGNIKIFFGKIINITDEEKMLRCQVKINGKTDEINDTDLPWYFPWYGISYLPEKDDVVPVIIFDDNFLNGFYCNKIHMEKISIDDDSYDNYLELFKRSVNDKSIELIYSVTDGIKFVNDKSIINITLDNITLLFDGWGITVEKNKVTIGDKTEPNLLGDKTVKQLHEIVAHQNEIITEMMKMFSVIASSASPVPFTSAIGSALTPLVTQATPKLIANNKKVDLQNDTLQSKKIFIG